jgi:trehalose 6-phosphate phosphatase
MRQQRCDRHHGREILPGVGEMTATAHEANFPTVGRQLQGGLRPAEVAFFLDVDGTLLELAPVPAEVAVEPELITLLRQLHARSGGAVAFVSGRSIGSLDQMFAPLMLPAAGLHGFERRNAAGGYIRRRLPSGLQLFEARVALQQLLLLHPQLQLEDKRFSLALHYRRAPELESIAVATIKAIQKAAGPEFELERGRSVVEIRPASASKARAIAEFMQEPPFRGRRPLCLGDDLADRSVFEWINEAGGLSLAVGAESESVARVHFGTVNAARMWLHRLITPAPRAHGN